MDKSKIKIYKSYDSNILEALFLKYGVSKYYIRKCISGTALGIKPDLIKTDYMRMEKVMKNTVVNLAKKSFD